MDKYEKLIGAIILIAVISSMTYVIATITGFINMSLPFFIFIPSWAVLCIPLIIQKRLEEIRRQEIFKATNGGEKRK